MEQVVAAVIAAPPIVIRFTTSEKNMHFFTKRCFFNRIIPGQPVILRVRNPGCARKRYHATRFSAKD
ncbi:hypothetical protein [Mycobacterium sp. UM_Kg1]|uniref:hypothetical protein n=1 Tax=Mycobacterium sp. UM_Kg1 TaxID=1545691 RepID=UPI00178CAA5E|nr:hypothetical protein [Mycobacterium sp. UM_Kg1]